MMNRNRVERKIQRKVNIVAHEIVECFRECHSFSHDLPLSITFGKPPRGAEPEDFLRRVGEQAMLISEDYTLDFSLHYEHDASVARSGGTPVLTPEGMLYCDPSTISEVVVVYSRQPVQGRINLPERPDSEAWLA